MTEAPVPGPAPRLELPEWRERHRIVAGITGRGDGPLPFDLGLGGTRAPVGRVMDHWRAFRAGLPEFSGVVIARQVHGTAILEHQQGTGFTIHEGADGHLTAAPGLLLAVSVADCIPVYVVDPARRVAMLLHAGWRGVAAGILLQGIARLKAQGSLVDNLLVHCGIGICGQCYEVGPEVFEACGLSVPAGGKGPLDLRRELAMQAVNAGVDSVSTSSFCSRHDGNLFFSHRGSGGEDGRMVAYLGLLR